jgi:hypothetical protein
LLIVAEALGRIHSLLDRLKGVRSVGLSVVVVLTILAWMTVTPAYQAARHLWKPRFTEELKPIMSYLSDHRQDDDVAYVYYGSAAAFRYYLPFFPLDRVHVVWGTENRARPQNYFTDLNNLHGKGRVWIVISHEFGDEKDLFFGHLDEMGGRRLDQVSTYGASLVLYDL